MTWLEKNWYLVCTVWFMALGVLGMTVLGWDETTNILLFLAANIWAASGNVRDDLVKVVEKESAK